MKSGSSLSVSGAALYRKNVLADLKRQMGMRPLQDRLFSSEDVPKETWHSFGMLHGRKTQSKVRERVMPLKSSDLWWGSKTN